jgi:hypothetical protein
MLFTFDVSSSTARASCLIFSARLSPPARKDGDRRTSEEQLVRAQASMRAESRIESVYSSTCHLAGMQRAARLSQVVRTWSQRDQVWPEKRKDQPHFLGRDFPSLGPVLLLVLPLSASNLHPRTPRQHARLARAYPRGPSRRAVKFSPNEVRATHRTGRGHYRTPLEASKSPPIYLAADRVGLGLAALRCGPVQVEVLVKVCLYRLVCAWCVWLGASLRPSLESLHVSASLTYWHQACFKVHTNLIGSL